EGIHFEGGARDGGGDLPAEELRAEIDEVVQLESDHGMSLGDERAERRVVRGVALHQGGYEQAVLTVRRRRAQRLAVHRHHALAVLAERFREELLDPRAEGAELFG